MARYIDAPASFAARLSHAFRLHQLTPHNDLRADARGSHRTCSDRAGARAAGISGRRGRDGEFRRGNQFHGHGGGPGVRDADGAAPPDVPGARLRHGAGARNHSGHRRPHRDRDAAAVHVRHGPLFGVRDAAGTGRDHRDRRPNSRDPVWRARRCRLRRDRARRLPDGEERRGRPRAERSLHVVADGRRVRRHAAGDQHPGAAADHALYRLARIAGLFGAGHIDGGGLVRQRAAARPRGRLPRRDDRDDRHRSANRHAALDLRQPLSLGRAAADAAAARHLRAAGTVRPADRARRHLDRHQHQEHLQGPVAGREGLLRELVADHALLVDRRRHRLDPRHQRLRRRLARLRPRAQDRERRERRLSARATCAA